MYNEDFYDGVLQNILNAIQIFTPKDSDIQIHFEQDSEAYNHLFLIMATIYAQLSGKDVRLDMGFFSRRKMSKLFKFKFKRIKDRTKILDAEKIKKALIDLYKKHNVIVSDRIFEETRNYYFSLTKKVDEEND